MFNQLVSTTTFADNMANEIFKGRITQPEGSQVYFRNGYDVSLISTTRALLHNRIPENETLELYFGDFCSYEKSNAIDMLKQYARERYTNRLKIIAVNKSELTIEEVSNLFLEKGYEEIEKVRLFFFKNFDCGCFVDKTKKVSIIVYLSKKNYDSRIRYFHAVQCAILNALPWFCDPENARESITPDEIELIKAIAEGDCTKYIDTLEKIEKDSGIKAAGVKNVLDNFEKKLEEGKLSRIESNLQQTDSDINCYMESIERLVKQRTELMQTMMAIKLGLEAKEGKSVLGDMFNTYKGLRLIDVDRDTLIFAVDKYLDDWNDATLKRCVHQRGSYLYRTLSDIDAQELEMLLTEVFDTKQIKIAMTGVFTLQPSGNLRARSGSECFIGNTYMPNPHIERYACINGYAGDIAAALREQNFTFAIEIAMQAAGNVNFEDSTVMNYWGDWMGKKKCNNRMCFELPTGERVSYADAINWIKERRENEQAN